MEGDTRPSQGPCKRAGACARESRDRCAASTLTGENAADWNRRIRALHGAPENVVQFVIINLVLAAEIKLCRTRGSGRIRRIAFLKRDARLLGSVGRRHWRILEHGGYRPGTGVELCHGPETQNQLDCP